MRINAVQDYPLCGSVSKMPPALLALLTVAISFAKCDNFELQVAQRSQTDRAAGRVSYGQKLEDRNWETVLKDIIVLSSTTVTYRLWLAKKPKSAKKNTK